MWCLLAYDAAYSDCCMDYKARYEYTQRQRQHCCKCRCVLTLIHVCMRLNIHRGRDIDTYRKICAFTRIHTRKPDDTVTTLFAHSHKTTIYSLPLMNEMNEAREKKQYNNQQNKTNACCTLTFTFLKKKKWRKKNGEDVFINTDTRTHTAWQNWMTVDGPNTFEI